MKRVKWQSKQEHEYINNYKVLQASFKKLGVEQVTHVVTMRWHGSLYNG